LGGDGRGWKLGRQKIPLRAAKLAGRILGEEIMQEDE
jgi:hypothetical protein